MAAADELPVDSRLEDWSHEQLMAEIQRCRAWLDAAFQALWSRYEVQLRRSFLWWTGDPEAAMDLTQEVGLRLYRAGGYDSTRDFPPFLWGMARKVLCSWWERAGARKRHEVPWAEGTDPEDSSAAAHQERQWLDHCRERLDQAVACSPERVQSILRGWMAGRKDSEVAGEFAETTLEVQKSRSRAIGRIREQFRREDWLEERRDAVNGLLASLPTNQQSVVLAWLEGKPYLQIASESGREPGEVWQLLYKGVGSLMRASEAHRG